MAAPLNYPLCSSLQQTRSALFLIRRSFVTLTPDTFIFLYTTPVRPHLEYAIQASNPYPTQDIGNVMHPPSLAIRIVKYSRDLSYE